MNIKIEPHNIGWLTFGIEDKVFEVSYLSDFINEIKDLLDFNKEDLSTKVKRIYLDGEGTDLYLTAWMDLKEIFIVWEEWTDDVDLKIFRFNFEEFKSEFEKQFDKIRDIYFEKFDLDSILEKK